MKRLFVLLISVFFLLWGAAHASEKMRIHEIYSLAYYEADVDRYDASKTDLDGTIVWTIDGLFSGDPDRVKYASLETGQVDSRELNNGYIIQKDPGEYTGVLYAVEKEGAVEIWHMKRQADHELVAEYDIALPYYEQGYQTVRAYMHGNLYYIKALEDTLFRTRRSPDNGDLMEEIS